MKRYYLSKIFKDVAGDFGPPNAWHHRVQVLGRIPNTTRVQYQGGEIKVDPATGIPTEKALLCLVAAIDHTQLQNDSQIVPLPAVAMDVKVSSIHTPTKLVVKDKIKALGHGDAETEAIWGNADGLRDVINAYGRKNNPDFDVNNFDLDES